jgi:hypothetical protein
MDGQAISCCDLKLYHWLTFGCLPDLYGICDKIRCSRTQTTGTNSVSTLQALANIVRASTLDQGVTHRLLIAEARIWFLSGPCGIYGRQNDTGRRFSPSTSSFPCRYIFSMLYSHFFINQQRYIILAINRVINLLKPTGHMMHQQFNIQQLYVLPTLYLCVLYLSENKQRLVPLTA